MSDVIFGVGYTDAHFAARRIIPGRVTLESVSPAASIINRML